MRQFQSTIALHAPASLVWKQMRDVVSWPDWMSTFTRVEALDAAELTLGRRFRVQQPRLRTAVWAVTAVQADRHFSWESRQPGLRVQADHLIKPHEAGVVLTLRFSFAGPLGWLVGSLYGDLVRNYLQQECAAYARRLQDSAGPT